ncbi:MAG: hypothetical protein NWE93_04035 [Candidatus Bathyarchaeota archaeon]|nr:hypothetical protein [Candidatus Bathyarchaeota archaeon]
MVETLEDYICGYMRTQTEALKGCLIAVYDSRRHYLSLLDESLGTPTGSKDILQCEVLVNAGLLREEVKATRDGRNRYKLFYLTDAGMEIAKKTKAEGYSGAVPQSTPLDNV